MKTQTPSSIKSQLKKLAKDFDLKYDSDWFKFIWISKRHARFLEYIGMCFDPIYNKFGKTIEKRIDNINKFENSEGFRKIKNEYSGQAITKKEVLKGIKDCKKIKNPRLKKELLDLHEKILKNLKENNLALLTKTENKKQKEILLNSILKHEWIHLLLIKNKIYFKSVAEKYWKYDEGLVTYLENYISKRLPYLELMKNKVKYPYSKMYYTYAIKFRELLKDKKTPKSRRKAISDLMKNLKQQYL